MNEYQIAWMAGILEGEGCFMLISKKSTDGTFYPTYRISVAMTDEDIIERLYRNSKMGRISYLRLRNKQPNRKPTALWMINKRLEIKDLCMKVLPFMGLRRSKKIREILSSMEENPPRPSWRHGTRQGYEKKCRCEKCRRANTLRFRLRRIKHRNTLGIAS